MIKAILVEVLEFSKELNAKHTALDFVKQSNKLLKGHCFYDQNISFACLIEEDDISRDEIVLGFDELEPTTTLSKGDIKILAQAVGLKLLEVDEEDLDDKSYIDLIMDLKGLHPDWVKCLSDRAAYSLLREGFNSVDDVRAAVASGLKVSAISNLGKAQVKEVSTLLGLKEY